MKMETVSFRRAHEFFLHGVSSSVPVWRLGQEARSRISTHDKRENYQDDFVRRPQDVIRKSRRRKEGIEEGFITCVDVTTRVTSVFEAKPSRTRRSQVVKGRKT